MIARLTRLLVTSTVAGAAVLSACTAGSSSEGAAVPDFAALSPSAEEGFAVAKDAGCMSCHGANGAGGVGPTWQGIAGSTVVLDDGTEVVADRDYLIRSIADPGAEKVAGYAVAMPLASLSDTQIGVIVDYLEELS